MKDVVLITNAGAGTLHDSAVEEAVAVLRSHCQVEVAETSEPADLDRVLAARGDRDVVIAGGDGSLHQAVAALQRSGELGRPTIGLIPLGTGNDYAAGLGLPLDPAAAAEVVVSGIPTSVDILVDDEGGVVVNVVHAGVGADAGVEAKPWKARFGKAGYVVGAITASFRSQGLRLRIVADGDVITDRSRPVLQVALGNGTRVGGGFTLTPGADPTDGSVDVLVSFAVRPVDRLWYGIHLKQGRHHERDDVVTRRASEVAISGDEFCCDTDGELEGPMRSRRWKVVPKAFTMMYPRAGDPEA